MFFFFFNDEKRTVEKMPEGKYIFLDFEIANRDKGLCAVGFVELVDGEIVCKKKLLINPQGIFENQYKNIHKITKKDVEKADNFKVVWNNELSKYFDGSYILVAHNTLSSEIDDLCKNAIRYSLHLPRIINYYDTKELAVSNKEEHEGLPELASDYGIEYDDHNPLDDAEACMKLFAIYYEKGLVKKPKKCNTSEKIEEIIEKSKRRGSSNIEDKKIHDYEIKTFPEYMKGKRVCISGLFSIGENEVEELCKRNGCEIKNLSTKIKKCNTDYIIVGKPNPAWADGIGNKTKGYEKFKEEGYDIKKLTEQEFYDACGITIKKK